MKLGEVGLLAGQTAQELVADQEAIRQLGAQHECGSVLGSWGKATRDAVRNKVRWKGRRAPTQDPSTDVPPCAPLAAR